MAGNETMAEVAVVTMSSGNFLLCIELGTVLSSAATTALRVDSALLSLHLGDFSLNGQWLSQFSC